MKLYEMIIKANADGKTYVNRRDETTFSIQNGFNGSDVRTLLNEGWEELPIRHLTVSEAEKELDCEIDTPDISKLFRSMKEIPNDKRNVIIIDSEISFNSRYCGFYDDVKDKTWHWYDYSKNPLIKNTESLCWIDPSDLIKFLPKE